MPRTANGLKIELVRC